LNVDGIISARIYSLQDDEIFIGTTNREYLDYPIVKSKFVCKLLLGTCSARGCPASLS